MGRNDNNKSDEAAKNLVEDKKASDIKELLADKKLSDMEQADLVAVAQIAEIKDAETLKKEVLIEEIEKLIKEDAPEATESSENNSTENGDDNSSENSEENKSILGKIGDAAKKLVGKDDKEKADSEKTEEDEIKEQNLDLRGESETKKALKMSERENKPKKSLRCPSCLTEMKETKQWLECQNKICLKRLPNPSYKKESKKEK